MEGTSSQQVDYVGSQVKPTRNGFNRFLLCLTLILAPGRCWSGQSGAAAATQRNQVPARSPENNTAALESIEALIQAAKYQEALPQIEHYLREYPRSARAHYDLGYAAFRTHDFRASIVSLSKSLALNPGNPAAHKILALDCSLIGRYDLAETELREAVREDAKSAEIHYFLGRLYYTRGVYPLAKQELEEAVRLDPKYMKAYDNLGLTMEVLGDKSAALRNYAIAIRLSDDQQVRSEWPYVNASAYFNRLEQPDKAIGYAQKAAAINPNSDPAYAQMAKAYRMKQQWKECAGAAQKAIAANPHVADYYYMLGVALRKLGDSKGSAAALRSLEKLHNNELNDLPHRLAEHGGQGVDTTPGQLDHD